MVLEKTLESLLDCKEIKPVKNLSLGSLLKKINLEYSLEVQMLKLHYFGSITFPIGKAPHAGKDLGQEKKRAREGKMVGWHH